MHQFLCKENNYSYLCTEYKNARFKLMAKTILTMAFMAMTLGMASVSANAASSLELIEIDQQIQITLVNGALHITGGQGQVLEIYNVAGVRVMTARIDSYDKTFDISLTKGCYIVKVGKTARKISVR